ncbi:tyrosine-type recombinase/integrase [Cerasicoccus frondis]|uniref:tyrosine-type recombinase/integrase n=1 Tax=Cerasicoccus frondis TaxID=490090 RepID=UPI0028527F88|nr:site-specific integrase [Cerasicoccus frondis]
MDWLKDQERIPGNPLNTIKKVDTRGKQAQRRAFTDEELEKLLAVAGKNRLLYLTAAYTGLRLGELRQVLRGDVIFDHERPHIKARAITTKNRKSALVPLHPMLAEELKKGWPYDAPLDEAVFSIIKQPDAQFRRHLDQAGISRLDALGRKLDFHALRYTFATKLAREGTAQRTAQELMRHSDPKLTAQIYTDASQLPTFDAVQTLSWIFNSESKNGKQRATTTRQNIMNEPELTQIFNAWGSMPQHLKDAVMVMVKPYIEDSEPS